MSIYIAVADETIELADRVLETTQTTGTGAYSLDGVSAADRQSFIAGIGTGNKTIYVVELATEWEIGIGTVTEGSPDTMTRDYIWKSSNSDAAVNWGAGIKSIYIDAAALLLLQIFDPARMTAAEARLTELTSQLSAFEGTKALFVQATAPIGWTQDTSQSDRLLRIADTTVSPDEVGGATGGSWTISGVTVDGHALTSAEMPSHTHSVPLAGAGSNTVKKIDAPSTTIGSDNTVISGSSGSNDAHTHGLTADGVWRPAYQNVIVCTNNNFLAPA